MRQKVKIMELELNRCERGRRLTVEIVSRYQQLSHQRLNHPVNHPIDHPMNHRVSNCLNDRLNVCSYVTK